jgi:hypothetical protein
MQASMLEDMQATRLDEHKQVSDTSTAIIRGNATKCNMQMRHASKSTACKQQHIQATARCTSAPSAPLMPSPHTCTFRV